MLCIDALSLMITFFPHFLSAFSFLPCFGYICFSCCFFLLISFIVAEVKSKEEFAEVLLCKHAVNFSNSHAIGSKIILSTTGREKRQSQKGYSNKLNNFVASL